MPDAPPQTNDLTASVKLAPPRPVMPEPFLSRHKWEVLAVAWLLLAIVLILIRLLNRKPSQVTISPIEQVRRDLQALRTQPQLALVDMTRIVRRFVAFRSGLPNEEFTTTEICDALKRRRDLSPETVAVTSEFLRRCDVMKFSPAGGVSTLHGAPRDGLLDEALGIVNRLHE